VARLIALVVPLALATFAASGRPRGLRRVYADAAGLAAPMLGFGAGFGIEHLLGREADYLAAIALAGAAAFLLADEGEWLGIVAAIGFAIGLLDPPFAATVIMIGVQAIVASGLELVLAHRIDSGIRSHAERAAGLVAAGIAIYLFFDRLAA
jgi:putative Mn2+ efflux pump MntP